MLLKNSFPRLRNQRSFGDSFLSTVLWILARFRKIGIVPLNPCIFRAMRKLPAERGLALLGVFLGFDSAFIQVVISRHITSLAGDVGGRKPL